MDVYCVYTYYVCLVRLSVMCTFACANAVSQFVCVGAHMCMYLEFGQCSISLWDGVFCMYVGAVPPVLGTFICSSSVH